MAPEPISLSVVVPVYNSEAVLSLLVERLEPALRLITSEFELILVNDGSPDGSWRVIEELACTRPWIRGIDMLRNYGQHNALLCGVRAARNAIVVTMDDDLQHPPEEIAKLALRLGPDCDVVYGSPLEEQHGLLRDLASQMTKFVLKNAMGAASARSVSAFRAFRTELRSAFADYRSQYVSLDVLLTWGTRRFAAVKVRHDPRRIGVSNYTYRKLFLHALNMVTGFSTFPLQVASWIGFLSFLFGMGVFGYVLVQFFVNGSPVQGFTFLASLVAILSGTQLLLFGVMGEYLARMHFRMMDRPTYAVRTTVGGA